MFPRKFLKWFAFPLLMLVWLPVAIDQIVWQFEQTDAVGDFGVFWVAWIAVPATVFCVVLFLVIFGGRLLKRKLST
jgi:hypothetical protein